MHPKLANVLILMTLPKLGRITRYSAVLNAAKKSDNEPAKNSSTNSRLTCDRYFLFEMIDVTVPLSF